MKIFSIKKIINKTLSCVSFQRKTVNLETPGNDEKREIFDLDKVKIEKTPLFM